MAVSAYLMLQGTIFTLGLLSDDDKVQVLVSGLKPRDTLYTDHISKEIQFVSGETLKDTCCIKVQ